MDTLWGVKVRRLWCLGSEGSARLWQAGSKGGGIALRAMSFIARLAGIGLHWNPPSTTSWSPSPRKRWEARLKSAVLSSMLPAPLSGGEWRAQRDGKGRLYGPLCGPSSEGSKGGGIALRAMSFIARLAGTGLHWRPPPPPLRGPPPPASGGRQGLRAQSSPPCYLPTPFLGVGGERSETEGGGCTFFTLLSFLLWSFRFLCRLL